MNIAVIFAGGSGNRMHTKSRPKQFLEYNGKPIIIYTLELFDNHPFIDAIVVVCIESWIPFLEKMLKKFEINKVVKVVPGGATGQESIFNGLVEAENYSRKGSDTVESFITITFFAKNLVITISFHIRRMVRRERKTFSEKNADILCVSIIFLYICSIILKRNMSNKEPGYVYILTNPSFRVISRTDPVIMF